MYTGTASSDNALFLALNLFVYKRSHVALYKSFIAFITYIKCTIMNYFVEGKGREGRVLTNCGIGWANYAFCQYFLTACCKMAVKTHVKFSSEKTSIHFRFSAIIVTLESCVND